MVDQPATCKDTNSLGTKNLLTSLQWYDIIHFEHIPSCLYFWFHSKDLIILEMVILPYQPMIIPLFNLSGTLIAFPPNSNTEDLSVFSLFVCCSVGMDRTPFFVFYPGTLFSGRIRSWEILNEESASGY